MGNIYHPSFEEVQQLCAEEQQQQRTSDTSDMRRPLVPFYTDILADMETPVSAYCKTVQRSYSFLLESVSGGEQVARYSFIGIDPHLVITHKGETATLKRIGNKNGPTQVESVEEIECYDPLQLVEAELGQYRLITLPSDARDQLPEFFGGAAGYLAYDAASRFERLPQMPANEIDVPLAIFMFTETVLVFDHVRHRVRVVTHLHLDAPDIVAEYERCRAIVEDVRERLQQPLRLPQEPEPIHDEDAGRVSSNCTRERYEEMVRKSIEYIKAGDIFQVVPSQRLSRRVSASPFTVYRALRAINPSPYMYFVDLEDFHIVGASPELLVLYENDEVTIRPIAGTRPRGVDRVDDERLAEELINDPKERAEHVMLLDLARNDVGRVSEIGSIKIDDFMTIERYSHVMHLVTNVSGKLRKGLSPFDALRAGFPAGTVSGAPKIRAMEIISELEGEQRGIYAGAVGYFSHNGNQSTAIALRTMVIKDGRAYIQAGAGIVADSIPGNEYQESINKAQALLRAIDEAEAIAQVNRETRDETVAVPQQER
jgi:anthranilate synthase component 1